jgi:hypothetical protein
MPRHYLELIAVTLLWCGGCMTRDVNPPTAKAGTGYVDFYSDDSSGLCWRIDGLEPYHTKGRTLVEEFKARTNEPVRLAFAPGHYRFGITFLNRAVTEPGTANVQVEEGKVTPVEVTLVETGKALIEKRRERMGASYARTGRTTKVRASEGATFRVEAEVQNPISYRPKERMLLGNDPGRTDS